MNRFLIFTFLCIAFFMSASAQGVLDLESKTSNSAKRVMSTEANGHNFIDLGLSVKWADCNIGAKTASDYGDYFAWGEVNPKGIYSEQNSSTRGIKLNTENGLKDKDAATANWGGNWRIPTPDNVKELFNKCEWVWSEMNGVNGYKIIGPNGNSIFLPAAGKKIGNSVWGMNTDGMYGTTGTFEHTQEIAKQMNFDSNWHWIAWINRCDGLPIRAVIN